MACNEFERQRWSYDEAQQHLLHVKSGLCLDLPSPNHPETLSLAACRPANRGQRWAMEHVDWSSET